MRQFPKQPPRGVPRKRCSENMQQVYKRASMPKCDFNKVALQLQFVENPWFLATWATLSPFSVIHIVLPKNGALPFYNTNFLLTTSKISDKFDKPVPRKAAEDRQAGRTIGLVPQSLWSVTVIPQLLSWSTKASQKLE